MKKSKSFFEYEEVRKEVRASIFILLIYSFFYIAFIPLGILIIIATFIETISNVGINPISEIKWAPIICFIVGFIGILFNQLFLKHYRFFKEEGSASKKKIVSSIYLIFLFFNIFLILGIMGSFFQFILN